MTVFDFVGLILIAVGIIGGYKKGFIKSAVSLISLVVALAMAFVFAKPAANFVYTRFWPDAVVAEELPDQSVQVSAEDQKKADGLIGALADRNSSDRTVSQIIEQYNQDNGTDYDPAGFLTVLGISADKPAPPIIYELSDNLDTLLHGADSWISQTANSGKSYAEAFTRSVNRFLTVTLLSFVFFVVILVLTQLILKGVAALLTGVIDKIPVLGGVNHLLGGVMGVVLGAALAFVFFVVLRYAALLSTDTTFSELVTSSAGYGLADQISVLFLGVKAG